MLGEFWQIVIGSLTTVNVQVARLLSTVSHVTTGLEVKNPFKSKLDRQVGSTIPSMRPEFGPPPTWSFF